MRLFLLSAAIFLASGSLSAKTALSFKKDTINDTYNKNYVLNIKKTSSPIKLDGLLDEPGWMEAGRATDFRLVLPIDTGLAKQPSTVWMTYDDKAFYVAFSFSDTVQGKRIMESYRRDFIFGNNDNFLVFFDTFRDQTNGFSFGLSASGAKWDGMMYGGYQSNLFWDCKWESKVKHFDDRWTAEMRIPFKSIRYQSKSQAWNVNFSRLDLKTDEKSAWAPVPRQFPTASLAYTGVLKFDNPLPESKMMFSLIPYVFGSYSNDYENNSGGVWKKDFGFDAKVSVSTSMNLDLAYNPEFSQVEVDQQVTNIDRFELFFPEKRQFFLENSDLFSGFGYGTVAPFFSRRIGLDAPVLAGARLSGKIGDDWRIGFMNMTTRKTDDLLARNFTVASVQKKVFARSNFGFIFVNKEYLNQPDSANHFNRVLGFDYNLASKNNFWTGKFFYHRSFTPENPDKQYSQGAMIYYNRKNLRFGLSQTSVGENYNAEVGFVPRTGYNFLGPEIAWLFVPNKWIVSHGIDLESENYFDKSYSKIEYQNSASYEFNFRDQSSFEVEYMDFFVKLDEDFDPTHQSNAYLPKGSSYHYGGFAAEYNSTRKNLFGWSAEAVSGNFYNGEIHSVEGNLGYRFQPYMNFTLGFAYTDIHLPQPFKHTKFWLVSPKLDMTFSENLFLSAFVQYNEQIDNMNINMRFQWRYQPVSDLFIVYTDNYIPGEWASRNRAVVVKLTYWLN